MTEQQMSGGNSVVVHFLTENELMGHRPRSLQRRACPWNWLYQAVSWRHSVSTHTQCKTVWYMHVKGDTLLTAMLTVPDFPPVKPWK